jgi:outer membrane protein assembly factor BamD (BamD/ComL family)
MYEGLVAGPDFKKADDYAKKGNYNASVGEYEKILAQYPRVGDRALFEMGIIYLSARNQKRDYQKSVECFLKLTKNYPNSKYRQNSDAMISLLSEITNKDNEITNKDKRMMSQKRQIDELVQQVEAAEKKIEQMKEVDMNLKQKKKAVH